MDDENVFTKSVMSQMTDATTGAPSEESSEVETKPTEQVEPKEVAPQPPESAENQPPVEDTTEEDAPKGLSSEQTANWKALRQAKKEADRELKEYKARLTDLSSKLDLTSSELETTRKTFDLEEHNSLKAQLEDYQNQLAEVDILRSPEVKAAQERVKSEISKAEVAIKRQMPEIEGLSRILSMVPDQRDKAITSMLEDASPSVASRVWSLVDRIDAAQVEAEQSTNVAQDKVEAWRQNKDAQARSEQEAQQKRSQDLFLQGLQAAQDKENGFPQYFLEQEGEEFDDSNKFAREATNFARDVMTNPKSEEEFAQVAFLAGIGKTAPLREHAMQTALAASEKERAELKARIEELEKATPSGSSTFNEGGSQASAGEPGSFARSVLNFEG